MSYRIITDATADLTAELVKEWDLTVIPMDLLLHDKPYVYGPVGGTIDPETFYAGMRLKPDGSSSQIPVLTYETYFRQALEAGEDVLNITLSSALSGTYQASMLAAEHLKEEFPDRQIVCIDSKCASIGEGMLACYAARKKREGMSLSEVTSWLEDNRTKFVHWFTVDNVPHLHRSGRLGTFAAKIGTMLNIKPVLRVDDEGKLVPFEMVKGRKKALRTLADRMAETFLPEQNDVVLIGHADAKEDALYLRDAIREKLGVQNFLIYYIGPVIGCHTSTGVVAVFYRGSKR